jgi:glycosyltransferase involved in cell wall biosynthesis
MMVRIVLAIDKMNQGGAERQFIELARSLDRGRFAITAVIFHEGGDLLAELASIPDLCIVTVPRKGILHTPRFLLNLHGVLRKMRPAIIYGHMGGTNEICLLMARLVHAKVIWGIRSSFMDLTRYGWKSRLLFLTGAHLSRLADHIIVNSYAGQKYYLDHGYAHERMTVIHNAIDPDMFHPDPAAGNSFREELGIRAEEVLIGHVGRIDPMKDHHTFLEAASLLARERAGIRFVCVGKGDSSSMEELKDLSARLGLGKALIWTGARTDMNAVYNGMDIFTSTSLGEGFSNAIGEAMACGRMCVVTDVGDSSFIVGDTGTVVPPRSPHAITDAWRSVLSLTREESHRQGLEARLRIKRSFSRDILSSKTANLMLSLLDQRA